MVFGRDMLASPIQTSHFFYIFSRFDISKFENIRGYYILSWEKVMSIYLFSVCPSLCMGKVIKESCIRKILNICLSCHVEIILSFGEFTKFQPRLIWAGNMVSLGDDYFSKKTFYREIHSGQRLQEKPSKRWKYSLLVAHFSASSNTHSSRFHTDE